MSDPGEFEPSRPLRNLGPWHAGRPIPRLETRREAESWRSFATWNRGGPRPAPETRRGHEPWPPFASWNLGGPRAAAIHTGMGAGPLAEPLP